MLFKNWRDTIQWFIATLDHKKLLAKLLDFFLRSNESNINQWIRCFKIKRHINYVCHVFICHEYPNSPISPKFKSCHMKPHVFILHQRFVCGRNPDLVTKSPRNCQWRNFWKCDIGSASEKAFPGVFGNMFGCATPSKRGVLVHTNSLASCQRCRHSIESRALTCPFKQSNLSAWSR